MEEIYVRHVKLLGFERRHFPSKHFVYMLMVKWSDLSEKLVYRTYPQIHTFHKSLKEMFPIESGQIEKRDRIIPSLPAPRWVDSQKSRESRQSTLSEYFDALVALPAHITRCQLLGSFFKVRPEDESPAAANTLKTPETLVVSTGNVSGPILLDSYRAVADFRKTSKHEMSLTTGDLVDIIEKDQNGWWFCLCESRRGWVPASYLEPLDSPEEAEELAPDYEGQPHITLQAYNAQQEDEISLEKGETIEVIHKLLDGWWVVRKDEQTGHFPSTFLEPVGKMKTTERVNKRPPPRRSTIKNLKSIHIKNRQHLSQDVYRRNSHRFLQQKARHPTPVPRHATKTDQTRKTERPETKSELTRAGSSPTVAGPLVPPRPSPELILQRCTESTRKRVSVHERVTSN